MNADTSKPSPQVPEPTRTTLGGILGSLRFALGVVIAIAAACVAGTLIPQGSQVAAFLKHNPQAAGRMRLLDTLGLTHVFFSWWFILLLCVLAASLTVCTYRRYLALRHATGPRRLRIMGSLITHISLLLVLAGGVVRAAWGEKGEIAFRENDTVSRFIGQRGPVPLPFSVRLAKFEIELYGTPKDKGGAEGREADRLIVTWPERNVTNVFPATLNADYEVPVPAGADGTAVTYRVSIKRYVPDFIRDNATRDVRSRSDEPNNPAILAVVTEGTNRHDRWLFARYPDFGMQGHGEDGVALPLSLRYESQATAEAERTAGPIKDYKSTLQIIENGKVAREKTIEVNLPLSYGGYTFYQSGYDPRDPSWTSLQVVRDPGVLIVYAGFVLMMIGLTVVFWLAPAAESSQRKAGASS